MRTYHVALLGGEYDGDTPVYLHTSDNTLTVSTSKSNTLNLTQSSDEWSAPDTSYLVPNSTKTSPGGLKATLSTNASLYVIQPYADADTEGYLAIPDVDLGTEYIVPTFCPDGSTCQFAVTPTEDDTSLCITVRNGSHCYQGCGSTAAGSSDFPCHLNEFDVFYMESSTDLSGTHIIANKKVAVFIGAIDVTYSTSTSSKYRLLEQIPPVNKWGKNFAVIPSGANTAGELIKIITKTKNTQIYISGFSPFVISEAGESVVKKIDRGIETLVEASKPVLILQIFGIIPFNSTSHESTPPSMVLVRANSQIQESPNENLNGADCKPVHVKELSTWTYGDTPVYAMCNNNATSLLLSAVWPNQTAVSFVFLVGY